jgi:hypothetical protein
MHFVPARSPLPAIRCLRESDADSMANLSGKSMKGFLEGEGAAEILDAANPRNGQRLQPGFVPSDLRRPELGEIVTRSRLSYVFS